MDYKLVLVCVLSALFGNNVLKLLACVRVIAAIRSKAAWDGAARKHTENGEGAGTSQAALKLQLQNRTDLVTRLFIISGVLFSLIAPSLFAHTTSYQTGKISAIGVLIFFGIDMVLRLVRRLQSEEPLRFSIGEKDETMSVRPAYLDR